MADPIPALFKLSLDALIEHVKNKKLKFSPDQLPPTIHNMIWNDSTVLDLIIHTCHPETRIWFSTRVIHIPPVLSVEFRGNGIVNDCQLKIRFENRPTVTWTLAKFDWTELPRPKFIIRTGNQYVSTQMDLNNADFTSTLPNYDRSRLEVINWICKVFRCEISELVLHYGVDDRLLKWDKLKLATSLTIGGSNKPDTFKELIMERHKNNLRTTLETINIETPLQKELMSFIDFTTAWINFRDLKVDQLIEEFRLLSQREHCIAAVRTMDLSNEDFELFKAGMGFSDRSTTSMINRRQTNSRVLLVSELKDGKLTNFRFLEKEPGVYYAIIMNVNQNARTHSWYHSWYT
ncbi:hypothetical protein CAEBREN_02247 [Caenorhabditis brenneri]|uniref:F-box associated domain-containing protein n=1 Tax=Caenorhabditis brenneri TaxID=135651 RepID=G0MA88_CAEBE|nr:hypothetical protein CAEBREN_02247 [Caenorhabditis brenneri]